MHEQFGYAYDAAWNLQNRTNNALVQTFNVNNLNELTSVTRNGTLTVAGTATERKAGSGGNPPGVTGVTVSGTGLTSGSAELYENGAWAREGATPADGENSYTATAQDSYGRQDSSTVTVNLPANNTFVYDLNGNLRTNNTRIFDYDDENQLIRVTEPGAWKSEFSYDGLLRRRVRKEFTWGGSGWTQTNEVRYLYDGNLVIQERNNQNLPQVTYTRGNDLSGSLQGAGGISGLLARTENPSTLNSQPSTSAHAYYHADGNGNVTALVNTNGRVMARYSYDPYGNVLTMSGSLAEANLYRFSSKEWHQNSGLVYYLYRYYSPTLQRWLNRDPIGESGGVNLCTFVQNRPTYDVDESGLQGVGMCLRTTIDFGMKASTEFGARPPPVPKELIDQAVRANQNRNRVPLPDGRKVDLAGKGHPSKSGDIIDTPHVHDPKPPHPPPYCHFPRGVEDVPRPANLGDIIDALCELGAFNCTPPILPPPILQLPPLPPPNVKRNTPPIFECPPTPKPPRKPFFYPVPDHNLC